MFKQIRRIYGLLTGDVRTLRAELAKHDHNFVHSEAERELLRMRSYAREKGVTSHDYAYPDIYYAMGVPPRRVKDE